MTTATMNPDHATRIVTGTRAPDLDTLHQMPFAALEDLYRRSPAPATVPELDGRPRGRMLAVRGLDRGRAAAALRRLSRSALFPWNGKNFYSTDKAAGDGINRINLLGLARPHWFRFTTRLAPSLIDGQPCFQLDYGLPENPPGIRQIIDELREVGPGLYLGPAQLVLPGRNPRTVLYFAIQTG